MAETANAELDASYRGHKTQALELLSSIRRLVEEFDRDGITWGHAGSLGHAVEELGNIHEFLNN